MFTITYKSVKPGDELDETPLTSELEEVKPAKMKLRLIQRNIRGGSVGSVLDLLDGETAEVYLDNGGVMITAEEVPDDTVVAEPKRGRDEETRRGRDEEESE